MMPMMMMMKRKKKYFLHFAFLAIDNSEVAKPLAIFFFNSFVL